MRLINSIDDNSYNSQYKFDKLGNFVAKPVVFL